MLGVFYGCGLEVIKTGHTDRKGNQMKREENYSWLIGYNMGDYVYTGMYWQFDEDGNKSGNNQYSFDNIRYHTSLIVDYKEFRSMIDGFDLSEVKRSYRKSLKK